MPQKHAKNNGSSTYGVFSHRERKNCEFMQTQEARAGADSQLPFGWCALSLQPAVNPVCTPSGHVYSKEAILEHMVTKGAELKAAREKYERDQARLARAAADRRDADSDQLRLDFERANDPVAAPPPAKKARTAARGPSEAVDSSYGHSNFAAPVATSSALVIAQAQKTVDFDARDKHKSELARTCFWLPSVQPEVAAKALEAPPKRPPSPVTGAELRARDLYPLDLKPSTVNKVSQNANDGQDVKYLCHVSGDEITTQPVLLIRNTGCVVLEPVAKRLKVLEEKRCPVTGQKFRSKDVVRLKTGVSGYAASGGAALQVKKYRAVGGGA